jgi:hypothetical protein
MKFLTVPDKNNLIVNTELTKVKITVRIKLKWSNLEFPSFYLVGRHLTFPVTTKHYTYIPWVEIVFPNLRFGQL